MDNNTSTLKINKKIFDLHDLKWDELAKEVEIFNKSITIHGIEDSENQFLLDIDRIEAVIECLKNQEEQLGEIDLTADLNMFQSHLPPVSCDQENTIQWEQAGSEIMEDTLKFLFIPSDPERISQFIGDLKKKISDLEPKVEDLQQQENKLRESKDDPQRLNRVLTELHSSKRKLKSSLIHLRRLTILQLTMENRQGEILDELLKIDDQITEIQAMLFG